MRWRCPSLFVLMRGFAWADTRTRLLRQLRHYLRDYCLRSFRSSVEVTAVRDSKPIDNEATAGMAPRSPNEHRLPDPFPADTHLFIEKGLGIPRRDCGTLIGSKRPTRRRVGLFTSRSAPLVFGRDGPRRWLGVVKKWPNRSLPKKKRCDRVGPSSDGSTAQRSWRTTPPQPSTLRSAAEG